MRRNESGKEKWEVNAEESKYKGEKREVKAYLGGRGLQWEGHNHNDVAIYDISQK